MEETSLRCLVMLVLQITSWLCANSRPFAANDAFQAAPVLHQLDITPKPEQEDNKRWIGEAEVVSGMGSSPPSCENKCYGCVPCEATQVPTVSHVHVQFANYEPLSWRCKCGPSFYSP